MRAYVYVISLGTSYECVFIKELRVYILHTYKRIYMKLFSMLGLL